MKNVFLGLFLATTMMSFTNLNASGETVVLEEDYSCTVSGSGVTVTANSCSEAYARWKQAIQ